MVSASSVAVPASVLASVVADPSFAVVAVAEEVVSAVVVAVVASVVVLVVAAVVDDGAVVVLDESEAADFCDSEPIRYSTWCKSAIDKLTFGPMSAMSWTALHRTMQMMLAIVRTAWRIQFYFSVLSIAFYPTDQGTQTTTEMSDLPVEKYLQDSCAEEWLL